MNEGARSATVSTRRTRLQRTLIAFETAIALVLLVGAGLLVNSFGRLVTQDAGMRENGLWAVTIRLPLRYQIGNRHAPFWDDALERVRTLPQVESAAIMVNSPTPLSGGDMLLGGIMPEGKSLPQEERLSLSQRRVSSEYFTTVGIPILKGRAILKSDTAASESVAVINEVAAAQMWPGEDPVGKRFAGRRSLTTVVGVIPNIKLTRLDGDASLQMYIPYPQEPTGGLSSVVMLRAKPQASGIPDALRSLILNMEKDATIEVATMDQVRWNLVASERFRTAILLIFAAGATFLALVGIFGVVSYSVVQRNREIGLRVALGAKYADVVRLMVRQAMVPAMIGFGLGTAASVGATRLLKVYLFQIQSTDATTFAVSLVLLAIAAFIAGYIPARRASVVDPIVVLRYE
jgi:putative ABC transport system permease protein